jgi:hypothetical protein
VHASVLNGWSFCDDLINSRQHLSAFDGDKYRRGAEFAQFNFDISGVDFSRDSIF